MYNVVILVCLSVSLAILLTFNSLHYLTATVTDQKTNDKLKYIIVKHCAPDSKLSLSCDVSLIPLPRSRSQSIMGNLAHLHLYNQSSHESQPQAFKELS